MNKLILTAVITVAIVAGAGRVGRAQAQSAARPDFSGKWALASSQPSGLKAFGDDFSIAQDATTFEVDSTSFSGEIVAGVSESATRFPIRAIYVLDGIEHPRQVIANPPLITISEPTSGLVISGNREESISKATWAGRYLVIMTYSRIKITAPWMTPSVNVLRMTVREAFSMETEGTLVVESLIVADPVPWAHDPAPPTPVRSIYKKG